MTIYKNKAKILSPNQDNKDIQCIDNNGNIVSCDNTDNFFDINKKRQELQTHNIKKCIKDDYTLSNCDNEVKYDNFYLIDSFDKNNYNCLTKEDNKITSLQCSDSNERQLWKNHKKNKSKIHNITDETKCLTKKDDYYYLENCDNNSVTSTCSEEDDNIEKIIKKISTNVKLNNYEIERAIIDNAKDTYSCQNFDKIKTKIIKQLILKNKYQEHFFNYDISMMFSNKNKIKEHFININKISLFDIFWLLVYIMILRYIYNSIQKNKKSGLNLSTIIKILLFIFFIRLVINTIFYIIKNAIIFNKSKKIEESNKSQGIINPGLGFDSSKLPKEQESNRLESNKSKESNISNKKNFLL